MDHTTGINLIMKALVDEEHGVIKKIEEICCCGSPGGSGWREIQRECFDHQGGDPGY